MRQTQTSCHLMGPHISQRQLALLNCISFAFCLAFNGLQGVLGRSSIGEVSRKHTTVLTPAGFAFSIWGWIYLGLAAFTVWQACTLFELISCPPRLQRLLLEEVGLCFVAANLCNGLWVFCFVQGSAGWIGLSSLLLFGIVAALAGVETRTGGLFWRLLQKPSEPPAQSGVCAGNGDLASDPPPPLYELLVMDVGFSLYLGWTTVASILNATIFLAAVGWSGGDAPFCADFWAIVMLVIAALLFLRLCLLPPTAHLGGALCQRWGRRLSGNKEEIQKDEQSAPLGTGNFLAALVFLWASVAIYVNATIPPSWNVESSCRLGGIKNVVVPEGCDRVAISALVLGVIVGVTALLVAANFIVGVCNQRGKAPS